MWTFFEWQDLFHVSFTLIYFVKVLTNPLLKCRELERTKIMCFALALPSPCFSTPPLIESSIGAGLKATYNPNSKDWLGSDLMGNAIKTFLVITNHPGFDVKDLPQFT